MKKTKVKKFDFSKKPRKAGKLMAKATRLIVMPFFLKGREVTVEKTGMENIKPPYLLFSTHSSMLDYAVLYKAIDPYPAHFVAALSGVRDVGNLILSHLGCFYKRIFTREMYTIRHMRYCAEHYPDIVCVFPESRYSFDGTTNRLPDSLGKTARLLKLPVVVMRMYGSYLTIPQWNNSGWKRPSVKCEMELVATAEEAKTLSPDVLQERVEKGLARDDYAYQRENKIKIDDPQRARGLHYILYQCPHCLKEFETDSEGTHIFCAACGKSWELNEYGVLSADDGDTEFERIPDWMAWQRENVRREVQSGEYSFESDVEVSTLPHYKKFYPQGKGHFKQTCEGTWLECTAYGEEKKLAWTGLELDGVHVEFDYPAHKRKRKDNRFGDSLEISTADDSYWLYHFEKRNQLMKISLATEEIYLLAKDNARKADILKREKYAADKAEKDEHE